MINFALNGEIVPKARPRSGKNRSHYLPENYRDWKQSAIWELQRQHQGEPIAVPVAIEITLTGKHSRRGDADNIAGAILDAMVQAGILIDDNLTRIPSLSIRLIHNGEKPSTTIKVNPCAAKF